MEYGIDVLQFKRPRQREHPIDEAVEVDDLLFV
jgi:hypothetical protein